MCTNLKSILDELIAFKDCSLQLKLTCKNKLNDTNTEGSSLDLNWHKLNLVWSTFTKRAPKCCSLFFLQLSLSNFYVSSDSQRFVMRSFLVKLTPLFQCRRLLFDFPLLSSNGKSTFQLFTLLVLSPNKIIYDNLRDIVMSFLVQ